MKWYFPIHAQNQRAEDLDNISIYFVAYTLAPARRAGNVVLVHETKYG